MTPAERVQALCDAMQTRDVTQIIAHFAPDAVYQNVGQPAARGRAAIEASLTAQLAMFTGAYAYEMVHLAAAGPIVLTERIDVVGRDDGVGHRLPVMGTFEVRDGLIVAWRDYWDSSLLKKMLTGQDYAALLP